MKPFSIDIRNKKIADIVAITDGDASKDIEFLEDLLDINAINLDLSEPLYRIFSWDRFVEVLRNKELTFVRTEKFIDRDPYENFLLNATGRYRGKDGSLSNIRDAFYVSCWSLKSECDGLWRNYGKRCNIKVKTNSKNLFKSVYDINNDSHEYNSYFIGKVSYVNDNTILKKFNREYRLIDLEDGGNDQLVFIQQLYIKRKPFNYEQEVRIVIRDDKNSADKIQIPIDPNVLFEEIVLDPWIKLSTFKRKKRELLKAGFTGKIIRSSLYDKPFFKFKIK